MIKFIEKLPEGLWIDKPEMLFPWGTPLDELEKIGNPKKSIEVENPEQKRSKKIIRLIWEPITIHGLPEIKRLEMSYLMTKDMTILFQGNFSYHVSDMNKLAKSLDSLFGNRTTKRNSVEDRGMSVSFEHTEWHFSNKDSYTRFTISTNGFDIHNRGPATREPKWKLAKRLADNSATN